MTLLASFTDLEQLVWEDIQSDGLGIASQADSDSHGTSADSPQIVSRGNSAFLALGVDEMLSGGDPYPPSRTSGDAGSGTFAAKQALAGDPQGAGKHASSHQPAGVGPFSALELQQRLDSAPSGGMRLPSAGTLLTQRTRALAAAAGSLRTGAVGSNLRLAALMYRSNSGGLADTLLSEQARAESGLLIAGLPRSDSLPELNMPLSAAELAELSSLKDLDLFASMPSAGLPSLSMLFNEPPDLSAAGHQHDHAMAPASCSILHDADAALRHAPASAWALGRMMMRPNSFTALTGPPMFGGSHAPAAAPHMGGLPPQTSGPTAGLPSALQPPTLVDYSCMVMPKEPAGGVTGQLAGPTAAAGGLEDFPGLSLPSHSRLQPLLFERQDTFELLMRQVGHEMVAEAQVQQYAALELDTMDVPPGPLAAAAASAVEAAVLEPAFIQPSAAEAAVPAVLAAAAAAGPSSKRRSVFELKRPSAFEAAAPAHLSAPAGTPAAAAHAQQEPVGPSLGSWAGAAPADPSTCSQVSDGSTATAAAAAAALGAATGGLAVPTSPFCLPTSTGLLAGDSSAATDSVMDTPSKAPAAPPAKQEVARYSRVLTCKTYLKRLNITQAMAEHLLPPHDLSVKPQPRASSDGGGSDDERERGSSTYGTLFKDYITIVDEHGTTYRIQYEGVSCNAQKHLRLTCGWRDYIRRINAEVGDSVVFERRGKERSVLYVTLVKGGAALEEPAGPATKKRRIGRKQAVQRLE